MDTITKTFDYIFPFQNILKQFTFIENPLRNFFDELSKPHIMGTKANIKSFQTYSYSIFPKATNNQNVFSN